jgi:hypothetical protein
MNEHLLALYMGYALCHGIQVQHLLASGELTVPYVIYWNNNKPTPVPYPAATQEEAVAKAHAARGAAQKITGWSSGREGSVAQNDGTKRDVLFIEGSLPGMSAPLEMLTYYRKDPFRLIAGFMWKPHAQVRKDSHVFTKDFQLGIHMHQFGEQCMSDLQNAERVQFTR